VGDKTGVNAYTLNQTSQFVSNKYIINLERRPDRRENMKKLFDKNNIKDYEIYKATDGKKINLTQQIKFLFRGNDFGNKKAVIGCALSHYTLWKKLLNDTYNKYYMIFEDDIRFCDNFHKKLADASTFMQNNTVADILFLGYHAHDDNHRNEIEPDKHIIDLDKNKYIGGFFGYIITKRGAERILNYIGVHGIKHGIDYLIKIVRPLKCINYQPHIVYSEWVRNLKSTVDSDIQKETEAFDFNSIVTEESGWVFIPNRDSMYSDIRNEPNRTKEDMMFLAGITDHCVAFNTLGYFKSDVTFPLVNPYGFGSKGQGIYIKRDFLELKNKELYGDEKTDYINLINQ
jgi:GR25 family glycosyltransferase involved in LPS biosynthesis